ncbi:MAG: mechanosensitive ion channel family protein, partial [Actinomycetota bacterium]|nr:mechanosensitive ion channel family protein [Actinomycetota bacterium]
RTLTKVLTSAGVVTIWVLTILTVLGTIPHIDVGPLIAGLGIGGVAIGFGAQSLVRDIVTGFFILLEDQYGIGDIVEVNKSFSGTVEQLTLRLTGLRDIDGTLHYISNGNITQVSNRSKDWSGVLVDVKVAYDSDLARVRDVLEGLARQLKKDERIADDLLELPAVLGVEAVEDEDVVLRLSAQVKPGRQLEIGRLIRERIKAAFDEATIEVQTN